VAQAEILGRLVNKVRANSDQQLEEIVLILMITWVEVEISIISS
jgi:hypothetical protein